MSEATGGLGVWYFAGTSTRALTVTEDGSNLPEQLGPWRLVGTTRLEGDGFDVAEARRLIDEHGYVCFD